MKIKKWMSFLLITLSALQIWGQTPNDSKNVSVDIFLGVMDLKGQTFFANNSVREYIAQVLLSPCPSKIQFCNMEQISSEAHSMRFFKEISGKKVTVTVYNGSLTGQMMSEGESLYEAQIQHSRAIQSQFISALQTSDKVIYIGHSRFGGGPDFYLPVFTPGTTDLDINYYRNNQSGVNDLLTGLDLRQKFSILNLGLFSCSSQINFGESLRQFSSKAKFNLQNKPLDIKEATIRALRYLNGI